ncbi:MAG: hypothetical protein COB85_04930 [Bacteroidetes bacterium]|nr:MAG: hypothetical protein COB85_04930 [Bacteroidota bacterium]
MLIRIKFSSFMTKILIILILLFPGNNAKNRLKEFNAKLDHIVQVFKLNILDRDLCLKLKLDASKLARDVKKYVQATPDLAISMKSELLEVAKKGKALNVYISCLRDTGMYITSLKQFNYANNFVYGDLEYMHKAQYCSEVLIFSIDEFVAYIVKNPEPKGFMIRYSWKKPHEIGGGTITLPVYEESIQILFDNQMHPERLEVELFNIICTPFPDY